MPARPVDRRGRHRPGHGTGLTEQVAGYFPGAPGIRDLVAAAGDMGAAIGAMSFLAGLVPAASYGEGLVRVIVVVGYALALALADRAGRPLRALPQG